MIGCSDWILMDKNLGTFDDQLIDQIHNSTNKIQIEYNDLTTEINAMPKRGGILKPLRERMKAELDDLRAYEKELLDYLETGKANGFKDLLENYFPRMWNLDAITKYSDHFKAIIYNYYKNNPVIYVNGKKINLSTDPKRLQKVTDKTYDDIINLRATTPTIQSKILDEAIKYFLDN